MEGEQKRLIELLLGLILIILLFLLVFLVTGISKNSKTQYVTVSNSYNTDSYNSYPTGNYLASTTQRTMPYYTVSNNKYYLVDSNYNRKYYFTYSDYGFIRTSNGLFGTPINKYEVYITNKEYKGGYFTVRYYFEDYYGKVSEDMINQYVGPHEQRTFLFRDISPNTYKYRNWWYEVYPPQLK